MVTINMTVAMTIFGCHDDIDSGKEFVKLFDIENDNDSDGKVNLAISI